ncbi:hypothetical protein JQC92_14675 [Shewanella sp. 202IG2-18]|uniref:hypothetical protein n=1 Tax=Parashewanella hymeniacidonis TaxID=2807618 RepID=UPI00196116A1|nr:hypothetical protein [Parashewanella hymeniacidonis]MBM7073256.1 hypothetical protein [Parashewanella hymeniacidonis]
MINAKLMKATYWARREFSAGSVPCHNTIKKWINDGVISGRVIGNKAYVFASEKAGLDNNVSRVVNELLRQQ